jgi:hypothetical protein
LKNFKKFILLGLLLTVIHSWSYAQEAKKNVLFFEKVYLHTDREIYAPGENIWFSAYLLNAQNNALVTTSNTLYVTLESLHHQQQDSLVLKRIIRIENGRGFGDFSLGDSIPAGLYKLSAWTNWMRNFGHEFVFEKDIQVLENGKISPKTDKNVSNTKAVSPPYTSLNAKESIYFFPEGGSLIDSVMSLVAFKAVDMLAKPIDFEGAIYDSKGESVTEISSKAGLGIFMLQPVWNENYIAKGTFSNGKTFTYPLPKVLTTGIGLHVIEKDSLFNFIISTNTKSQNIGKYGVILLKSKGKVILKKEFQFNNIQTLLRIAKKDLPHGITTVTIFDQSGKPQSERLIYVENHQQLKVNITTDKAFYRPKEQIQVTLKVTDAKNIPVKGFLSFSAVDSAITDLNSTNIASYLQLSSEIKGKIENPQQYFNKQNPNRLKQLDLLLLTQGWREYLWRRLADTTIRVSHIPEKGITLSGKVKHNFSEKPIANANVSLFANGATGDKLFATQTDSLGKYYIDGLKFYGKQTLRLNAVSGKGKNMGWIILDSLFKTHPYEIKEKTLAQIVAKNTKTSEILRRSIQAKKQSLSDTILLNEVKITDDKNVRLFDRVASTFGYKPEDFTVTQKDYDYTNLMHYILHKSSQARELTSPEDGVSRLVFPYMGKNFQPRFVINNKELPFTDNDPQYMRDDYYNTYLTLPMNKVERVVIKHLLSSAQLTQSEETGMSQSTAADDIFVIYLYLKPNALVKTKPNAILEELDGYYQAKAFYQPKVSLDNPTPDERTTIFWNPSIVTNEQGEAKFNFRNPSPKTKIRLSVEGVDTNGSLIYHHQTYEIK